MALEIERKFLVADDSWRGISNGRLFVQGYLQNSPHTVRIRIEGDQARLNIKGPSQGISRLEFDYPIPRDDAELMLRNLAGNLVRKIRYTVPYQGHEWVIDEFLDQNCGLILAEIELKAENETFDLPPWAGREVSDDHRYANSFLADHPFSTWKSASLSIG